ncbi:MAG: sensor domain-containing diguanylate cyclase [Thermodesulfovibrionia bacterium]|nr:sensor domain-containing diguanylate cyclase [Thermodesulfovibrionia bacterium]
MKKDSCSVHGFRTIEKSIEYTKTATPDVILLRLTDALKKKHVHSFQKIGPVIGIPGKDSNNAIKKAFRLGIEELIIQPYTPLEIKLKIEYCLQKKQYIDGLKKEKQHLNALLEITSLISSSLNSHEILHFMVKKIAEVIPVVRCSMIRIEHEQNFAHVIATYENPRIKTITLDLDKYPEIKETIITKSPVIVNDVNTDPLMAEVRETIIPLGIKSIIVLPIFFKDTVIGTLFLRTSRREKSFTDEEIMFCRTVANTSANALYNAFLYEKSENEKVRLGKLAITDFLTGLYNTRYLYHRLEEEFNRAHRYSTPISCLMMDIDLFKRINDAYGHKTGDRVLKEFAHFLKINVRKTDILARYGGEEFIILLPNTSHDGALTEAERLSLCIKRHKFKSLKSKRVITVSIGITTSPHKDISSSDDLITCADTALFKAKNTGRSKVIVY